MDFPLKKTTTTSVQMQLPTPVPSSSTQTYQYSPLRHDCDIRLLYLLPGYDRAPLLCSLRIVSSLEPPVYEAVSYTWGEPIFSASIECSSLGRLPITENLSAALLHLRLVDRIRVLWVDAICINQQDLVERSHQVTLLRDTFEKAENVIVWLGEDTGDASEAFKILRVVDPSSSSITDIVELINSEGGKALRKLLERSWFRRIWVVQELVCARKATIKCGTHSMKWETFLDVAERLHTAGIFVTPEERSVQDALLVLSNMRREMQRRNQRNRSHLELLLYSYRLCLASDPRDKVFALVGIAHGQIAAAYTPNYSREVPEVYRDLAIHLIIAERNPDFLLHCAHIGGCQASILPSWVPDWSQPLYTYCSPLRLPGAYEASTGTSFKGRVSEELDELFLDGVVLNKVERLGSAWNFDAVEDDWVKYVKRTIELNEECLDMFRESPRYRNCYWSAFIRALVADKDCSDLRVGQRNLSEVYVSYRKFLSRILIRQVTTGVSEKREPEDETEDFDAAVAYAALGRTFCLFDDGRAGWVIATAEVGDRIAIFLGAKVPILLRPRDNGYIVLGEAYVHEMMDGQAFEGPDVNIETITLI